jgi:hypothetical protein
VALSGLAPDVDVLAYLGGILYFGLDQGLAFEHVWQVVHHRYTHGLGFVLLTGVVAFVVASRGTTRGGSAYRRAAGVAVLSMMASLVHVFCCLAYSDGAVGELSVSHAADDGAGAMAGGSGHSGGEPTTATERVRFDRGMMGTELTATLTPGSSVRYVLKAKNGQDLYVRVAGHGPDMYYQIFNPDGSFLFDQITSAKEYRGQLWQSGDHVIEVINRGNRNTSYNVIFGIE